MFVENTPTNTYGDEHRELMIMTSQSEQSSYSRTCLDGSRTKLLPYTNFYVEVLTQFWIKLLHVEVLTKVWIKLLHVEVLTIFPDKTSTLTK